MQPAGAGRRGERGVLGEGGHVGFEKGHLRRDVEHAQDACVERIAHVQPAGHAQQLVDRDRVARVVGTGPGGDRRRCVYG